MGKRVLVVGQGGREHTLVWKLAVSPEVEKIYAAPGNAGIAELAECIDIAASDVERLARFAEENKIDLTVIGPEAPLMAGVVDVFAERGLLVFGPSRLAARLEGSKVFSKNLMRKYGIPTADFQVFEDMQEAVDYVHSCMQKGKKRLVVKVDGLAAGKGVVVAQNEEEALRAVENMMAARAFGAAGDRVIIEECLVGEEVSVFALADGENVVYLGAAQDHKRVYDNDQGPNTGGMGAYSPAPLYTPELHQTVMRDIIIPTARAMVEENCPYRGVLYAGLMVTEEGPKVLEYNARFGDPETQVVVPLMDFDLFTVLEAAAGGRLDEIDIVPSEDACVCVVLASGGYPGAYTRGYEIQGLNQLSPGTMVFHAGTRQENGRLVTDGGRVLGISCRGKDIRQAMDKVYAEVGKVDFTGVHYRTDIGRRALKRLR